MVQSAQKTTYAVLALTIVTAALTVGTVIVGVQLDNSIDAQARAFEQRNDIISGQDRAAMVNACESRYFAVADAWAGEAGRLFGVLVANSAASAQGADPALPVVEAYREATANAAEMERRLIGLASVPVDNGFVCPPIPVRLRVAPVDPMNPAPPNPSR